MINRLRRDHEFWRENGALSKGIGEEGGAMGDLRMKSHM